MNNWTPYEIKYMSETYKNGRVKRVIVVSSKDYDTFSKTLTGTWRESTELGAKLIAEVAIDK